MYMFDLPPIETKSRFFRQQLPTCVHVTHMSQEWDSNPRPMVYDTIALPLSYPGISIKIGEFRCSIIDLTRPLLILTSNYPTYPLLR